MDTHRLPGVHFFHLPGVWINDAVLRPVMHSADLHAVRGYHILF